MKNAVVFFCYRPPKELFNFASKLKNDHDVFVSVNDNEYEIPEYDEDAITLIKLDDKHVVEAGYYNSNFNIRNQVSSRDKAFYYFNRINNINYKHIWFIEEDVFVPTTKTLSDIDKKYPEGDYMANSYYVVDQDVNNLNKFTNLSKEFTFVPYNEQFQFFESPIFHICNVKHYLPFPWLKGMTCAIRVSKKFLNIIDHFAIKNKKLLMDEILYATLSLHNGLSMIIPKELSPVIWDPIYKNIDIIPNRFYWEYDDIRSDYLFHPIKDLKLQNELRKKHQFDGYVDNTI
jgi:hypothetical protein